MSSAPFLLLSPALPSELLTYILTHHVHPTTLIICSSRLEFLASLSDHVLPETANPDGVAPDEHPAETSTSATTPEIQDVKQEQTRQQHRLLSSPLYQVATSRHIRVVYIPTVTHLRAYLTVFSPDDSKVPVPPAGFNSSGTYTPCIILYGFLEMHRDTSEWSAQGLGNSTSALVELGYRLSWQTIVIEPRKHSSAFPFEDSLRENVPFLSGGGRRLGPDAEAGGWTGRTVEVGRVMKRWFDFQLGEWDLNLNEDK
ncbi:hypothetical protein F4813DRAFT_124836 [Daldinia decipiens]|uniref:uncharacterized protein n=1 Tax=Daldinia decipiens TaxID=326647 RepID=UPI0020C5A938|nr:uncharacterized protein F4813DRAFT_124836 [Daldinia decipiens]KAI1656755.1 hypothetical protein F4813DRAFT_124836 [Daldinia decipiens]